MSEVSRFAAMLTSGFGISVSASEAVDAAGSVITIVPSGLPEEEGFGVEVRLGWANVVAAFVAGPFARHLIEAMGKASREARADFVSFARAAIEDGGELDMRINEHRVDPLLADLWPRHWKTLGLSIRRSPLAVSRDDPVAVGKVVTQWGGYVLGMTLSLMPTWEAGCAHDTAGGQPEGRPESSILNRYERNPLNRMACILFRGHTCVVCGFDFGVEYGSLGQGFIHVHHVVPVAQMGADFQPDPRRDLVPVCPNCHAMMHRRDPPLTVEEMKRYLRTHADPPSER